MPLRILLAGATGAIGKPLLRLPLEAEHYVYASTRSGAWLAVMRHISFGTG